MSKRFKFKRLVKYVVEGIGVIFILVRPDGTFLMQKRDGNCRKYPNMWCFPGGGSEKGETFADTAIREIKEEYGLDVTRESLYVLMSRYLGRQKVYVCKVPQEAEPIMVEGADMKWMSMAEIESLHLGFEQDNIKKRLFATLVQDKHRE